MAKHANHFVCGVNSSSDELAMFLMLSECCSSLEIRKITRKILRWLYNWIKRNDSHCKQISALTIDLFSISERHPYIDEIVQRLGSIISEFQCLRHLCFKNMPQTSTAGVPRNTVIFQLLPTILNRQRQNIQKLVFYCCRLSNSYLILQEFENLCSLEFTNCTEADFLNELLARKTLSQFSFHNTTLRDSPLCFDSLWKTSRLCLYHLHIACEKLAIKENIVAEILNDRNQYRYLQICIPNQGLII